MIRDISRIYSFTQEDVETIILTHLRKADLPVGTNFAFDWCDSEPGYILKIEGEDTDEINL